MASFFSSLFGGGGDVGETKSSANIAAETLGNPHEDDDPKQPTLSSTSSSSTSTSTTTTASFAQFRQISLPGEWMHDSSDVDSDVGSGRFKFGFESLQNADEIINEFTKLIQLPIGPKSTFIEAANRLKNTSIWTDQVDGIYHQVITAYIRVESSSSNSSSSSSSSTGNKNASYVSEKISNLLSSQHIYGVALMNSNKCRNKISNHSFHFSQGNLLRLKRKDNDTWHVCLQDQLPISSSNISFDSMTGMKSEIDSSVVQVVCTMYRLSKDSEEYNKVKTLFGNTNDQFKTFEVDRVQNTNLWQDFYLLRERLFRRLGPDGLNEKLLWHGCSGPVVLPIASGGFDWRLCGLHGTAYGRGAYFAKNSTYSQNNAYSKPDAGTNNKHMFLARVLVGRTCQGTSSLQRPPPGIHSAINGTNEKSAAIFVTFDIAQSFPLYHVTFKK
jgi:hypothetical protein